MSIEQELEKLTNHYDKAKEQSIRINAEIESAEKKLAQLKEEAIAQYGTDDIEQLAKILDDWEKENAQEIARFNQEVENLKQEVAAKEHQLKALEK